ncbi:MAG TPA: nuclear transport factor 2 family protein [Vicinamibacterales bacterium]|nr:nuclear transport factor 2 family protein [Vicinamibacterales bacterium]
MSATLREVFDLINDTFAKGDTRTFLDYCTDDVVWTMVGDRTVQGKQAVADWMASMQPSDLPTFTTEIVAVDGDVVAATGGMTMKEKDGSTGRYSYCDVYRFRDGKVAELRSFVIKLAE